MILLNILRGPSLLADQGTLELKNVGELIKIQTLKGSTDMLRPTPRSGQPGAIFLQPSSEGTAAVLVLQHPSNALKFSAGEKTELGVTHLELKRCHSQPPHLVEHSSQHLHLKITDRMTSPDHVKITLLVAVGSSFLCLQLY